MVGAASQWILLPMVSMVMMQFLYAVFLFFRRRRAVNDKRISHKYFRSYQGEIPTDLKIGANHYQNLHQWPTIFLITCCVVLHFQAVTIASLGFAWLFVISRAAHTYIHLGRNRILRRAFAFLVGLISVLGLWLTLLIKVFIQGS